MKQLIAFIRKEFIHIFRDGRTMLILLVMPLLLVLIFGYAVSTEVRGTLVAVADEAQTPESHALTQAIDASQYFSVARTFTSAAHAEAVLTAGEADVLVVIAYNGALQILADGSEPNQAQMRAMYLQQIAAASSGAARPGSTALSTAAMGGGGAVTFLYNPQQKSEYNFVPGVIGLIILIICAMLTSVSIVREKEMGTMEVLLASPLRPLTIIIAKLVPYFVMSSFNLVTILLLAHFVMGVPIAGSITAFTLLSLLYIFVSLALGLLISCAVQTQMAAMLLSLLLFVPTVYLSGMVFPIESLPPALQRPTKVVPASWFMDGARRLLIQSVPVQYLAKNFAVLTLEAFVLIGISLKLFKKRL